MQYEYTPLTTSNGRSSNIRVLTLFRGESSDGIRIKLDVLPLYEGTARDQVPLSESWEALSYTWGSNDQPKRDILVQLGSDWARLEVFENLYLILQWLRLLHEDRRLWIDAICINQRDTKQAKIEKALQIPLMHEVYKAASKVLIWLGPQNETSTAAMQTLKWLGQMYVFDEATLQLTTKDGDNRVIASLEPSQESAILSLLSRPWFSRVWIRQEVFAASDRSMVICGQSSMLLPEFRNGVQCIAITGLDATHPDHDAHNALLTLVLSTLQRAQPSVLQFLSRGRSSACLYPQDRIYGSLGMMKLAGNPEYVKAIPLGYPPTEKLFQDFVIQYCTFYGTIQPIEQAGLCQRSVLDAPSWVPDWTVELMHLDLSLERATSHALFAEAEFPGPSVLRLKGCFAATIREVLVLKGTGNSTKDNYHLAVAELARVIKGRVHPHDEEQMDAFARAFCSPILWIREPMEKVHVYRHDIKTHLKAIAEDGMLREYIDVKDRRSPQVFQALLHTFQRHQLPIFLTEEGGVGVGPIGSESGDLVTAVLGSKHLVVLRPARGKDGKNYELVGSAFMHGFNWGEALLGPLPASYSMVPVLDQVKGIYQSYYFDAESGNATFWDPRIDWGAMIFGENERAQIITAPDGETRRLKAPASQYLREEHRACIADIDVI